MINFNCKCGKEYSVDPKYAGKKTKCRNCGAALLVPTSQAGIVDTSPPIRGARMVNKSANSNFVMILVSSIVGALILAIAAFSFFSSGGDDVGNKPASSEISGARSRKDIADEISWLYSDEGCYLRVEDGSIKVGKDDQFEKVLPLADITLIVKSAGNARVFLVGSFVRVARWRVNYREERVLWEYNDQILELGCGSSSNAEKMADLIVELTSSLGYAPDVSDHSFPNMNHSEIRLWFAEKLNQDFVQWTEGEKLKELLEAKFAAEQLPEIQKQLEEIERSRANRQ